MNIFEYVTIKPNGKKVKGKIKAVSVKDAVSKLRSADITILDILEIKSSTPISKVTSSDLETFSRQLASLVSAHIPIVKGLGILADQTKKKDFQEIILSIQKNIEDGGSLADSFSRYPNIFSSLFVNMINVGEFSGTLDIMLERLATHIESYNSLVKKAKAAMMYPIGIIIVAALVLTVIFVFVIPGFKQIFSSMGGNLPLPTQILLNISDFFRTKILYLIASGGILFYLIKRFSKTPKGSDLAEKIKFRMPIMGDLYHKMVLTRFTKTLSILVKSGISILKALEIAGRTSGSNKLEKIIVDVKEKVSSGKKLTVALGDSDFFPTMTTSMIGVGEEGGDLGGMLEKIADSYERDVNTAVSGFLTLIEPIILIFLGIVIGSIVIALFLPILKMHELVGP